MESRVLRVFFLVNMLSELAVASVTLQWTPKNPGFNPKFYEDLLDTELCDEQLEYVARNDPLLRIRFLEAGLRVPRDILTGNVMDLGNYHECLGINEEMEAGIPIQGKYCTINVPIVQNLLDIDLEDFNPNMLKEKMKNEDVVEAIQEIEAAVAGFGSIMELRDFSRSIITSDNIEFTLAVCIPKPCTTQQGISGLLFNVSALGIRYKDNFCRVPDDKTWVPADYVAIVIFSILGLMTITSTSYDIYCSIILKRDTKSINVIYRSFSVYTNTRRLTTFTSNHGALECIDGIRALAMMWIILGHTFSEHPPVANNLYAFEWQTSIRSIWVTAAPISVDTFFMLSGLLVVYTTAGKLTSMKLLKNLHLFYLNRILRMFPLYAAGVLLMASVFHRIADGPLWNSVTLHTDFCRTYWWLNMLYVQNIWTPMCLGHSWYIAIDMQLHIISPLILFWVLTGRKKFAWIALLAGVLVSLAVSTTYNFLMEFPGATIATARMDEFDYYMSFYYLSILSRASAFFVGMIFGYLLHLWRGRKAGIPQHLVVFLWIASIGLTLAALFATEPMKDINWDNQTVDSLVNSYMRPAWAMGLGCFIFLCVHGYGGPANWFLSLQLWKLPSRISYAMYLFHYPIQLVVTGTYLAPVVFSVRSTFYKFLSQFVMSFVVGFIVTLLIDSPFSTLFKRLLGGSPKKTQNEEIVTVR